MHRKENKSLGQGDDSWTAEIMKILKKVEVIKKCSLSQVSYET